MQNKFRRCLVLAAAITVFLFGIVFSFADTITDKDVHNSIIDVSSIDEQLDILYGQVAESTGLDEKYVKILYTLAGGKAIYITKTPDINNDLTASVFKAPLALDGAQTSYQKAPFVTVNNKEIERPSEYFLPDALYSVSCDIKNIMNMRMSLDRGGNQAYFDMLSNKTKTDLVFYEAVLLYTGTDKNIVDNLYTAYESILTSKENNENVIEFKGGNFKVKSKFSDILNNIGLKDKTKLEYLAIMLSYDSVLAKNDSIEILQTEYDVPYALNCPTRENMMVAAASLCGKVRYVWGGGHSGASHIDGINPIWKRFEALYPDTATSEIVDEDGVTKIVENEGFKRCLKSSGGWCPVHGTTRSEYHGGNVYSLEEYVKKSAEGLDAKELLDDKYVKMLSKVDYSKGINIHTLDGLDCSGFASWLYNQITDKYEFNTTAKVFTQQNGLSNVAFGTTDILPGDTFAWTNHIVVVVGRASEDSRAYVTIEQTPNVLKYGVLYYTGAKSTDVTLAKQIASEANELIGGINGKTEEPHVYCMDSVGVYTVTEDEVQTKTRTEEEYVYGTKEVWYPENWDDVEEGYDPDSEVPENYEYETSEPAEDGNGTVVTYHYIADVIYHEVEYEEVVQVKKTKQYHEIGRFAGTFLDENVKIKEYDKPIIEMTAPEIIQHTLTKLPISYVTGYATYEGKIFDKTKAATNLGVEEIKPEEVNVENNKDDKNEK